MSANDSFVSFEPSDLEVKYFAKKTPDGDNEVIIRTIKAELGRLPKTWVVLTHAEDGAMLYRNNDTGQVTWDHPRTTEILNMLTAGGQFKQGEMKSGEWGRSIETETELETDMLKLRRQHNDQMALLQDSVQASQLEVRRRWIEDTQNNEAEIKAQMGAHYAESIRRLRIENDSAERAQICCIETEAARQRQMFHADLQIAQSCKNKEILEESAVKAFQLKKKEDVRFKAEVKDLFEALQSQRLKTALAVSDYERAYEELKAEMQVHLAKMTELYAQHLDTKLKSLADKAHRYTRLIEDRDIKPLQEYIADYDARLVDLKNTLRRQFDEGMQSEIDVIARVYQAKVDEIRQEAEQKLSAELEGVGSSLDSTALLKSQVASLQERCFDEVLRASASLNSQHRLNQMSQELEVAQRKLADADALLTDRQIELRDAHAKLLELEEQDQALAAKPIGTPQYVHSSAAKTLLQPKAVSANLLPTPKLHIKSSFSDRMSAPTSTKASSGRNVLFQSPYNFEADASSEEDIQDALRQDMQRTLLSCDGGLGPTSSLPNLQKSASFYSRLLSRQVQSRIDLKSSLTKHAEWMDSVRNELTVAISGVRAKRRYVARRPLE